MVSFVFGLIPFRQGMGEKELSSSFKNDIKRLMGLTVKSVDDVFPLYAEALKTLPRLSLDLIVHYEHQESGKVLGEKRITYDANHIHREVGWLARYWKGERLSEVSSLILVKAIPYEIFVQVLLSSESWKCRYCHFQEICTEKPL